MILATCNMTRYPAHSPVRAARPRRHKSSLALAVTVPQRHCCRCSHSSAASDVQFPPLLAHLSYECTAFLASGNEPTGAERAPQPQGVQLAWLQLLVSPVKLLPTDIQLFEAHFPDKHAYLRQLLRSFEANWTRS